METDWSQAWEIGGLGFLLVFAVLILLALAMWLSGKIISRIAKDDDGEEESGVE